MDRLERFAQWAEAGHDVTLDRIEEHARGHADAFAEQRQAVDVAVGAKDLENRKRPPQQRIAPATRLDHDELPWGHGDGNFWSSESDDVVVSGEACVADDLCLDIDGHSCEYTFWLVVGGWRLAGITAAQNQEPPSTTKSHQPLTTNHAISPDAE